MLREMHDMLKSNAQNLNIVLYIQRGAMNDLHIIKHLKNEGINQNFTIIRSRDELYFMIGCLYSNSNKIVYASEYKHSMSRDLRKLMDPDPESKMKKFKHVNLKNFLKLSRRGDYLRLISDLLPGSIDMTKESMISKPIEGM